jgi:hypothetical protein
MAVDQVVKLCSDFYTDEDIMAARQACEAKTAAKRWWNQLRQELDKIRITTSPAAAVVSQLPITSVISTDMAEAAADSYMLAWLLI